MLQDETIMLIFRSRQNDHEAFRKIVEAHQQMVYSLSFRLLCNKDDASDVVQETFIKVWKHLSRFNTEMRFTTWLYKIATNICYDRIKALKRRNNILSFDIENAAVLNLSSFDDIETTVINNELAGLINILTQDLTPKQKMVFTLRDLEGLEVEEIAEITGLSPAKIKSNLYCARQFMRENLKKL